ncbi:MAG: hypothetical protein IAE94_00700 [Chthoniobacterales bacterium]|nr:hypothetical protein [Chthoniobacterales bacterium]
MKVTVDLAGQTLRRHSYLADVRRHHRRYFTDEGAWGMATPPPDNREWLWEAFAWLDGSEEDRDFANRLVLNAPDLSVEPNTSGAGPNPRGKYNIFSSTHAMHLLVSQERSLTPAAKQRLEDWARRVITDDPGGARGDLQFHGYNDNMPAKATLGLILGGEYFGSRRAVEHGLWNLHQLRLLLGRRGVIPEYCSPTYTPLTLTNLTEIADLAANEEARELAQACCEHLWAEVLAHYHAPTQSIAGPYSRAYATDSVGHLGNLHFLLWQVLGSRCLPDPRTELFDHPTKLVIHHRGDRFFVEAGFSFLAACGHKVPPHLVDWMIAREFPFHFSATTERGEGGPGSYSASKITVTSHQTGTFALGTSNGDWTQTNERWHAVYRRVSAEKMAGGRNHRDVRQLFLRYVVNDVMPGTTAISPRGETCGECDFAKDGGSYQTLQHEHLSMVMARPFVSLAGQPVERLGLGIVVPEHVSTVDDLRVEKDHVWFQDGPFLMMICPLGIRGWGTRPPEVTILTSGSYRIIFLPNYIGVTRTFTEAELQGTTNAFVAAMASSEEVRPDAFRATMLAASARASIWVNQCVLSWEGMGHRLELCQGLVSHGVRFATVDGKEPHATPWLAEGLPQESLPFTMRAHQPNPYAFPYGKGSDGWDVFPSLAALPPFSFAT